MNDTWSYYAVDIREPAVTMSKKSIYERSFMMAGSRMNYHALRLIDDNEVIVFIYDIKRNILRPGISIYDGRYVDRNFVSVRELIAVLSDDLAVYRNLTV